ncbi:MAG: radical SAM protein [Planctomycetes bacterium]|nr:radical SAM protein [Planctomycetota bacterium]
MSRFKILMKGLRWSRHGADGSGPAVLNGERREERGPEAAKVIPSPPGKTDAEKIQYAKAVLSSRKLPTNFSITLGAAPCNHSCLFCPQSVEKPKKAEWLDLGLLAKVLNEMPEENLLINISSYSETLGAPNLVPAVRLMKSLRPALPIALATNGTLYREDVIGALMDLGLDIYSYSFDAANRKDYFTIMQVDDYERVWRNLERIVNLKREKKAPTKIYTHIMHFRGVEEDFEKFKAYWQDKLDSVSLRRVGNWGSDELGLMRRLEEKGFRSAHETPRDRYPCTSIFMHFKLNYTGHYYPCVAAIPAYEKHEVPALGHAREMTWMEAWGRLAEMRRAHLEGRWEDYECCRTCNIWSMWDNYWFEGPRAGNGHRSFFVPEVELAR